MSNISVILKLNQRTDSIEPIKFQPIKRINKADAFYYKVKVYNSSCDEIKPKCYSFPPLNSLTSFNGIISNPSFKSIPNKAYNKASSNVIHLKKYPIHFHQRRTSPLIKINSSLINVKVNSLLAGSNQAKTDESDIISSHPVMDLNLLQEEFYG